MKKGIVIISALLLGMSLTACGKNKDQSKENSSLKAENSSLKAKSSSKALSSLKAENSSLKNQKNNNQATSNDQKDPAALSNEEVAAKFKAIKGTTSPDYHAAVDNNGDGTYHVELRKDTPDGQRAELIGQYQYNARTGAIKTLFEP